MKLIGKNLVFFPKRTKPRKCSRVSLKSLEGIVQQMNKTHV